MIAKFQVNANLFFIVFLFIIFFLFFERKMQIIVQQYFVIFLSFKQSTLNNFNINALQSTYAQGSNGVYSKTSSNSWGPAISTLPGMTSHDLYKDFFQTGYTYNNNVSVYGGSDNSSLRLSAGNTSQSGIVPNSSLKRSNIRLTDDTKLTDKLTAGGTINYTNTAGTRVQNGSNLAGTMLTLTRTPAEFNIKNYINPDGTQ